MLDQLVLLKLNQLAGTRTLYDLADNPLFRGFPIFFSLAALWFADDSGKRRSRMLAGFVGVCMATVLSVWCQYHVPVHTRPLIDPALHLQGVEPQWLTVWDRAGSFPSDTVTLFFGLVAVIFLESKLGGLLAFLWSLVVVALPRVVFGFHYPSDVIGSLIFASTCVFFFTNFPYPRKLFERMLLAFKDRMYLVDALFVIYLAEAWHLFLSLENIGKSLLKLVH